MSFAWSPGWPGTTGGQVIEPAVDRHRGFTAVVVHLRSGSPPSPDGRRYNRLAAGEPDLEARYLEQMQTEQAPRATRGRVPAGARRRPTPPQPARTKSNR